MNSTIKKTKNKKITIWSLMGQTVSYSIEFTKKKIDTNLLTKITWFCPVNGPHENKITIKLIYQELFFVEKNYSTHYLFYDKKNLINELVKEMINKLNNMGLTVNFNGDKILKYFNKIEKYINKKEKKFNKKIVQHR
jgi:hypothetical protein